MKKKKDLLNPNLIEKDLQKEFTAVISTLATQKSIKKKIVPTLKKIKKRIEKKRKSKKTLGRLMQQ